MAVKSISTHSYCRLFLKYAVLHEIEESTIRGGKGGKGVGGNNVKRMEWFLLPPGACPLCTAIYILILQATQPMFYRGAAIAWMYDCSQLRKAQAQLKVAWSAKKMEVISRTSVLGWTHWIVFNFKHTIMKIMELSMHWSAHIVNPLPGFSCLLYFYDIWIVFIHKQHVPHR